jgi:2-succinyl-5-enolpyruvyl-6-hydroxy-3-cyclohexene-1-carboxylate synthase
VDRTNRNTALASALVEELARCGIRHAALAPGSRSTPLALALWRQPAIEIKVLVDERCAGFWALGAAQATGLPAAVLCTSGTAAANLHPAVVEADQAGVPLVALTADRPPELRGIGAGQTIDQLKLYGEAVRWFCEVGTHEADDAGLIHYRSVACRAFSEARGQPRPGPVHLNLAWREPLAPSPAEGDVTATSDLALKGRGERPLTAVTTTPGAPEGALLDELAERIAAAARPVIVAGRQPDQRLAEPLAGLAAAASLPILAEPTSQLRLGPHDRTRVISNYDAIARFRPQGLAPDLVLRVGDMPTSKALRQWLASIEGLRQIVVDPAAGWNEPIRTAETVIRADPSELAASLADRALGDTDRATAWVEAERAVDAAIDSELDQIDQLCEPHVPRLLAAALADGDLVFTASSMPIRDQEAFMPSGPRRVRFLCNRGANGIDGSISTAAGAAASGARTWDLLGDLALFHDMNGLAALDGSADLRLVVVNNDGGGIFHFLPQDELLDEGEFEALLGTPSGVEVADAASLYGLSHLRAATPDELGGALASDAVVVEARVDRRTNVEVHRRLAGAAETALTSA